MSFGLELASASSSAILATALGDGIGLGFDREKIEPRESGRRKYAIGLGVGLGLWPCAAESNGLRRSLAHVEYDFNCSGVNGCPDRTVVRNTPRSCKIIHRDQQELGHKHRRRTYEGSGGHRCQ